MSGKSTDRLELRKEKGARLMKVRRLKPPLPPKSCRFWEGDVFADEAFLVLRASSIRRAL
ncbi:hypothetical protein C1N70_01830 [Cytobacillus firmus]